MKYIKKFESSHSDVEALDLKGFKLVERKNKPVNFSGSELKTIEKIKDAVKSFSNIEVSGNTIKISPKQHGQYAEITKYPKFFTKKSGEKDRFTKHDVYHTTDIMKVLND